MGPDPNLSVSNPPHGFHKHLTDVRLVVAVAATRYPAPHVHPNSVGRLLIAAGALRVGGHSGQVSPIESSTSFTAAIASSVDTSKSGFSSPMQRARSRAWGSSRSCIQPWSSHSRIAPASCSIEIAPRAASGSPACAHSSSALRSLLPKTNPSGQSPFRPLTQSTDSHGRSLGFSTCSAVLCTTVACCAQDNRSY